MKIAFMAYDGKDYNAGPIINASRLLPALQARGHVVCALIPYMNGEAPNVKNLKDKGVMCKTIPFPAYTEDMIYWLLQEVKNFQPDIFIPNISFQGGFAARWVRESGIPTVIAHRSDDALNWCLFQTFVAGKPKWRVNGLVCVSQYLKEKSLQRMSEQIPVTVIPSGVPTSTHVATHQESDILKVVYAGRLVQKQKRIWNTIDTFIDILKEDTAIDFTIIGDGVERDGLEKKVRESGVAGKITFKGKLLGDKYHEELSRHQVIVLMSEYEGIPGSLMDGMVCGLVPVCLDIEGIRELIKHDETGLIIQKRSDLKDALTQLKDHSYRSQISYNARAHIQKNYSLDQTVSRWVKFCEQLVEANDKKKKTIKVPKRLMLPLSTMRFEGALRKETTLFSIAYFFHRVKNKLLLTAKALFP